MMRGRRWELLFGLAAVVCIALEFTTWTLGVYITKSLATGALLWWVVAAFRSQPKPYRQWIAFGLAWSLAGDVFLMLPGNYFIPGLASFLVAHLCYIVAFARDGGGLRSWPKAGAVGFFAAYLLYFLWPGLDGFHMPVTFYVVMISVMAWQAMARAETHRLPVAHFAAIGATFFLLSDSLLAFNRFVWPVAMVGALVLPTYWVAQYLIARSAVLQENSLQGNGMTLGDPKQ